MTTKIIKVVKGSRITIPKDFVEQLKITDYVMLKLEPAKISVYPIDFVTREE